MIQLFCARPSLRVRTRGRGVAGLLVAVMTVIGFVGVTGGPAAAASKTFTVTSTADQVDAWPGDGRCRAWSGACTLRAAVMESNATFVGDVTIVVGAGRFAFTQPAPVLDYYLQVLPVVGDDRGGDLDLHRKVTIRGAGALATIIDGKQIHRVFHNHIGNRAVISDLTLTGGKMVGPFGDNSPILKYSGGGGAWNTGHLTLQRVTVDGNTADFGGGVFNDPASTATFEASTISNNTSGEAGGVRCDNVCTFVNSTVSGNVVVDPHDPTRFGSLAGTGGGVDVRGIGAVTFVNSTVVNNTALDGGGLNAAPAYLDTIPDPTIPYGTPVYLKNTIVAANTSTRTAGNCRVQFAHLWSRGGNVSDDTSCNLTEPTDAPGTAPQIGLLADNGGPTDTHALLTGSPAVDNGVLVGCPSIDQRGVSRPQGPSCDTGSYERN